jgi:predicted XRE-type DNA-binding protein
MTTKIRRSSGNVFRDLGFSAEEATHLKIRSDLMIRLTKLIEARGLTQAQAAELFGVTQPRVSDLVRGKIDRFSIDTLIAMLGHAGVNERWCNLMAQDDERAGSIVLLDIWSLRIAGVFRFGLFTEVDRLQLLQGVLRQREAAVTQQQNAPLLAHEQFGRLAVYQCLDF